MLKREEEETGRKARKIMRHSSDHLLGVRMKGERIAVRRGIRIGSLGKTKNRGEVYGEKGNFANEPG